MAFSKLAVDIGVSSKTGGNYRRFLEKERLLTDFRSKIRPLAGFVVLILFPFKKCFPDEYYVCMLNPKTTPFSRG